MTTALTCDVPDPSSPGSAATDGPGGPATRPLLPVVGGDLTVPLVGGGSIRYVNLDYAASTPALEVVAASVSTILPYYASVHRGAGYASMVSTSLFESARSQVARLVGARSDDVVVFTRNTTDSLNLLSRCLPPDARVLLLDIEHHANLLPWQRVSHRIVPAAPTQAETLAALREALNEYQATLVAIVGASNVTGELPPLAEIVAMAHAGGARVVVDAAQWAPHRRIDLARTGVDYVAFSGHKLYAPYGSGVLAGCRDWLDRAPAYLAGGGAVREVRIAETTWAVAPQRHEAGTPNVLGVAALATACSVLADLPDGALAAHEAALRERLAERLGGSPGVRLHRIWPDSRDAIGVLAFSVEDHDPGLVAAYLSAEHGIGVRSGRFCAHPLLERLGSTAAGVVRASFGVGSCLADVDRLADALTELVTVGHSWDYALVGGQWVPDPDPRPLPSWSSPDGSLTGPSRTGVSSCVATGESDITRRRPGRGLAGIDHPQLTPDRADVPERTVPVSLPALVEPAGALTVEEVRRYSRHLIIPEVGMTGQKRLKNARTLCVGAGGLGSPTLMYLAAAGIGTLGVVDFDVVDESNLQRQIIHGQSDVGRSKAESARDSIKEINPHVNVELHRTTLDSSNALEIFSGYDLIVDGTDNFATRYLVNDAAVLLGKPYVWGSIYRFEGQASVFWAEHGPCYRCLYPDPPPPGLVPSCAEGGVLGVLCASVSSIQVTEAIKLLAGIGEPLLGRMMIYDGLDMRYNSIRFAKNPDCAVCGTNPTVTELIDYEAFCGAVSDRAQQAARGATIIPEQLKAWQDEGRPITLIDVREPNEYEIVSIPGAVLIPKDEFVRGGALSRLPDDRQIVLHCKSGGRSAEVLALVHAAGYADAVHLGGGVISWVNRIEPDKPLY